MVSARPRSSVPAAAFNSFLTWAAATCAATARLVSPVNSRPPGVLSCYEAANKAPPFYLVVVQVAEPATEVVQLHAVAVEVPIIALLLRDFAEALRVYWPPRSRSPKALPQRRLVQRGQPYAHPILMCPRGD